VSSQTLEPGTKVIVGSSLASQAGTDPATRSPLTPQRGGRGF
jgi:hypothetical protein